MNYKNKGLVGMLLVFLSLFSLCWCGSTSTSGGSGKDESIKTLLNLFAAPRTSLDEKVKQEIIAEKLQNRLLKDSVLRPLVIGPSLFGNMLEAELVNAKTNYWYCASNSDWYTLWFDLYSQFPFEVNCWMDNMKLGYDPATRSSKYLPGVNIRTVDYGGVDGISYMDVQKTIPAWANIISVLITLGYTPGLNVRGAPYDWRLGPDNNFGDSFTPLQKLIEETYLINGNTSVVLTSFSMGGGYLLLFLNQMSQGWKDKYIHSFVPICSCFGGSFWAPTAVLGATVFGTQQFDPLLSLWGGLLWLSPYEIINQDRVLFTTPTRKYTTADLPQLFRDAGKNTSAIVLETMSKFQTLAAPGVPTYCVFGVDVPTPSTINFETENFFNGPSTNTTVPGDGTCRYNSLDLCTVWAKQQTQPSVTYPIQNMAHSDGLVNPEAIRYLLKLLDL